MYQLAFGALVLTLIVDIFFGLTVLLRIYQKAFGRYFVLCILGLVLWVIGDAGLLFARNPHTVHIFAELFYIAPMATPVSIWFFALTFPENRRLPRYAPIIGVPAFLIVSTIFLAHFNFFIKNVQIAHGLSLNIAIPAKPGFYFYSAYFSIFFFLAYIAFWLQLRRLRGLNRTQVQYVFVGVLVGSVLALATNLSLPVEGVHDLIWMGPLFTLFFPGSVVVAIIRHRLFDIRVVIARSVGYVVTAVTLAIIYAFLVLLIIDRLLFAASHISVRQQIAYAILVAAFAFTFYPIRRFFERQTNRVFYRDAYDSQEFFNAFNKALVSTIELDTLLTRTASTIETYLKAQYCVIGVTDGGALRLVGSLQRELLPHDVRQILHGLSHTLQEVTLADDINIEHEQIRQLLAKDNIAVLARIGDDTKKSDAVGYIIIGPKKSGNPYASQDIKVLEAAADELLIAIQNALRFQEVEQFNITLQQKVDEATRKLRNSNDKLRALDQTKDDFISMASHQLRTPLTSVKGYVSMVIDGDAGPINPMQRKLLDQSFASAQRMVYLIADLLNISRLKTGRFVIEQSPTNLAQITKDEVSQLVETAKSRGLELSYDKPQNFPTYLLDTVKIRQVIMNFVDNAIYYTPSGGHVHVELIDKPNAIELRVIDDGIGVPRNLQHHLFTKFYRAPNAQKARPDGTGLGLFMAKKVVIAQGGSLIYESVEGKGSVFGFSFAKSHLVVPPQK